MLNQRGKVSSRLIMLLGVVLVLATLSRLTQPPIGTATSPSPQSTTQGQAPVVSELTSASCHARGVLPDATCTPGAASPLVSQANLAQTICVSGYTKTIRPPVSYTNKLKGQQMQQYGFTDSIHLHEEDHLISLELGTKCCRPQVFVEHK